MQSLVCDTSVLTPAMVDQHTHHQSSFDLLLNIKKERYQAFISAHSLAECYSSLMVMPVDPPVFPKYARELIRRNIEPFFEIISLGPSDYLEAIERVSGLGLKSGAIYDALIYQAALKKKVSALVTWNTKHFERFSKGEVKIVTPEEV